MKVKRIVLLVILALLSKVGLTQIFTSFNFATHNLFYYNPAHAGDAEQFAAYLSYKHHLTSMKDALKSGSLGLHSPISRRMSLGGLVKMERRGLLENNSYRLDYSFRTPVAENHIISFGINGGLLTRNLNYGNIIGADMNDPTLQSDYYKKALFFSGAGLSYNFKNFEFDFAMPVLYKTGGNLYMKYLTFVSYDFYTKNNKWLFQPSSIVQYSEDVKFNYQGSILVAFNKFIWFQATYKINNSLAFAGGVNIGKIGIAYAYETNSGALSALGGYTHEIMLSYGFNKLKDPLKDTIIIDTLYDHKLVRKIEGQTYEEYVHSNNYVFYNDVVTLTDSIHKEIIEQERKDSVIQAKAEIMHKIIEDSIKQVKVDSAERVHTLRHLSEADKELLKIGVQFKLGSSVLTYESKLYLDSVAGLMKKNNKFTVLATGYTCDLGSKEINERYSKERSEVVKYYLELKGVDPKRITTDAVLDAEPIVPNTSEYNRKLKRRVSFSIIKEQ